MACRSYRVTIQALAPQISPVEISQYHIFHVLDLFVGAHATPRASGVLRPRKIWPAEARDVLTRRETWYTEEEIG